MSTRPQAPAPSTPGPGKLALPELAEMKRRGDKIVMITAYDAPAARIADEAGVELILVGDTAAMVMLGYDSTVPVTLDELIVLSRAVTRSARRPLVIGDLPFGSYEVSDEQAVASAIRLVKEGGVDVVKLEGGSDRMVSRVRAIADSSIGVMAHIGLTPQSATKLGGFRAQGRSADAAIRLYREALALQEAGAFAIVLEAVPAAVAARVTEALAVPTIGIGAGSGTDGQVLVWHDMLGMYAGHTPRFVKRYAEIATEIGDAVGQYAGEVRSGAFPEERHTYSIPEDELAAFLAAAALADGGDQ
jgi:3-methyl-2-oxobutanoate hydroxymethyltransferase